MYRGTLVLIVGAMFGFAQEAPAQNAPPDPESLVSRLAGSRMPDNHKPGSFVLELPIDPQVAQAKQRLRALGTAAFPALVAHRDDRRYSHTTGGSAYANVAPGVFVRIDKTVGDTCIEIIAVQLCPGHEYQGSSNFIPDALSKENLPRWWSVRASKSLTDLRKEALEWTIAEERRRSTKGGAWGIAAKHRADELEADLRAMTPNDK
jgi:hypothetical protein